MARINCNFISYILKRAVDLTVIIPTTTMPEVGDENVSHNIIEKYPVLYLLHGYGNNHATWTSYSNIELFAEERNIAVVMLSGENKFYSNISEEDRYFDFVSEELPEFVENMFPVSKKKENKYIAGLSMGGYGALIHGLSNPERFNAIGAFSPAIDVSDISKNAINPKKLVDKIVKDKTKCPKIYMACGTLDFLYSNDIKFRDYLINNNIDVTWDEIKGYKHEWRFWNIEVEKFLDWLPRNDVYSGKIRGV
ncbi:MAG: alpha/beta hydrolase family protein [Clostridiaceae bacterium]|nr:alpha/beta hydrolase family protein [Clostridiaceae bacterium]